MQPEASSTAPCVSLTATLFLPASSSVALPTARILWCCCNLKTKVAWMIQSQRKFWVQKPTHHPCEDLTSSWFESHHESSICLTVAFTPTSSPWPRVTDLRSAPKTQRRPSWPNCIVSGPPKVDWLWFQNPSCLINNPGSCRSAQRELRRSRETMDTTLALMNTFCFDACDGTKKPVAHLCATSFSYILYLFYWTVMRRLVATSLLSRS